MNRRTELERKKKQFLRDFDEDASQCSQSLDIHKSLSEQDQRLTTKHIKTLTFLQDIVNENKTLKARNEQLEAVSSECRHLHELARDAPEKMKAMEEQYLEKMDEINKLLLQKHESELMRVVQEKMEMEKVWYDEKNSLQEENERLRKSLTDINGSLSEAKEDSDRAQMIQLKLDALSEENSLLKEEQTRYVVENENLRSEIQALHVTKHLNEKLNNELKSAQQNQKELQLKYDKLYGENDDASQNEKPQLMDQAKHKLTKLSQEKRFLKERCQQLEVENEKICRLLHEYTQQLANSEVYRDRLITEINMLREELQRKRAKPSGEKDFREFVNMKRELLALKEENEEMAAKIPSRLRTQSLLPVLKSSEPRVVVDRRSSASYVLSKK